VITAPHGRSYGHYLVGVLINVAIFVGLGPIVGCVVFFLIFGTFATGFPTGPFAGMYFMVGMSLWIVPAAYLMGSFAAALTGASVAMASSWLRGSAQLYGFAIAVGGFTAMFLAQAPGRNPVSIAERVTMFAVGAIAALVCTRVARPFRLDRRSTTMSVA
jgi:hypothetical protein